MTAQAVLSVDDSVRKGKGDSSLAFPHRKTSIMVVALARRKRTARRARGIPVKRIP